MSLAPGARICCHRWTELPLPRDAIEQLNQLGKGQQMPHAMTYVNGWGREIPNDLLDYYEDDDTTEDEYQPSDDEHSEVNDEDESTVSSNRSSDTNTSSSDGDDDDPNIDVEGEVDSVQEDPHVIPFYEGDHLDNETNEQHDIEIDDEAQSTVAEEMIEPNAGDPSEESTGVCMSDEESINMESTGVPRPTEEDIFRMAEQHRCKAAVSGQHAARPQCMRWSTRSHDYDYSTAQLDSDYLNKLITRV